MVPRGNPKALLSDLNVDVREGGESNRTERKRIGKERENGWVCYNTYDTHRAARERKKKSVRVRNKKKEEKCQVEEKRKIQR